MSESWAVLSAAVLRTALSQGVYGRNDVLVGAVRVFEGQVQGAGETFHSALSAACAAQVHSL